MSCTVIGRVFSAWARQTWMWAGSQDLLPGARLELEKMWKVSRLATSLVFARIHRSLHHNMHIMIHRGFQQSVNLDHTHRCWRLLEYSFLINEHDHVSQVSFFFQWHCLRFGYDADPVECRGAENVGTLKGSKGQLHERSPTALPKHLRLPSGWLSMFIQSVRWNLMKLDEIMWNPPAGFAR